jgi:IgGFc binding protein
MYTYQVLTTFIYPMKPIQLLVVLLAASPLRAQTLSQSQDVAVGLPTPTPYAVVSREANSALWQQQTYDRALNSTIVTNTHQYVELATGLNFKNPQTGQWQPSSESIFISPDGSSASATNSQHQVYFPGDIYNGVIKLVEADGQVLESQPIGLALSDGSNSVLLAAVTNSTGAVLSSGNQVIYRDAFAGLNADIIFSNTKAGMSQDIVLRQQLPDTALLNLMNLDVAKIRLQMITEFISSPPPAIKMAPMPTEAGNLEDDSLNFGTMRMGRGKAFSIGSDSPSVRVVKRWVAIQGRQFLIEEVPLVSIATAMDSLPPFVSQAGAATKPVVAKNLVLPPPRLVCTSPKARFLAQAAPPSQGLVLDYQTISGFDYDDFTFQANTTYYISGVFSPQANLYLQGGAVIKYPASGLYAAIDLCGTLICQTDPYHPAIFTEKDDNSVGEIIAGSTTNPVVSSAEALMLNVNYPPNNVENASFRYCRVGVDYANGPSGVVRNCQFVNDTVAIQDVPGSGSVLVENALFSNISSAVFSGFGTTLYGINLTVHHAGTLVTNQTVQLTNSLFICVTNLNQTFTGAYNRTNNSDSGVFASGPLGNEYLSTNSPYRDIGTTNIDPAPLAQLRQTTTYTPQDGSYLDGGAPDLGYHYPAILSTGTDFWLAFPLTGRTPGYLEQYSSLYYISSSLATTGSVTFPGVLVDGRTLMVTGCGDTRLNGFYHQADPSLAETNDGFVTIYVKGSFQVGCQYYGGWFLFEYDTNTDNYTAVLYAKESLNQYDVNGSDWEIYDSGAETNRPPPTTICALHPLTEPFSLAAGQATNLVVSTINTYAQPFLTSGVIQTNGIEITASQPVSVYALDYDFAASTAFTCYPTTMLGTNYCVLSRPSFSDVGSSQFAIVATENDTTVTIISTKTDLKGFTPPSTNIVLQQGGTYQVNCYDIRDDVTGVRVISDKPIAVFAGDSGANVPDYYTGVENPLIQQQFPVDAWGTNMVSLSFAGRKNGDTYRVLAAYSNTVVNITGIVVTGYPGTLTTNYETVTSNLTAGQSCDIIVDGPVWFQANQPIQVAQFANGGDFDHPDTGEGDPCEILLSPAGRYLTTSVVVAPPYDGVTGDFDENFLNLIVPQSATNSTYVGSSLISPTNFVAIGASGYYGAQVSVTNGVHTVTSSQPVGVEAYGWGFYDAYGYFDGMVK